MVLFWLSLLIVTSFAAVGLLTVWAISLPWHWFWRTLFVLAPLSLLLWVPAYEPLAAFTVEAVVIAGGIALVRCAKPQMRWFPRIYLTFRLIRLPGPH